MAMTASTMLPLGTVAPDFRLPDTDGNLVSPKDCKKAPAFLVIFMCNHCPFVKHILDDLIDLMTQYQAKDLVVVAINSNDVEN